MDDLRRLLFDPATARRLVLARRPASRPAGRAVVATVVSDLVWTDVVELLRWAAAAPHAAPALRAGVRWRLAAGCADLLHRLPALADELGERWSGQDEPDEPAEPDDPDDRPADERVRRATEHLAVALLDAGPLDLRRIAALVDALGGSAVAALAEGTWQRQPGAPG